MQLEIGQTYKVPSELPEDETVRYSPKKKIPAILLKEYPTFWLFQTKHYKTTVHKADFKDIKEVKDAQLY